MENLVSIVVPVYNVESYLPKCLQSICEQTYKNMEVILVNDGSTDSSLQICRKYVETYGWSLVDKENGGLSSARNAGLKEAVGEYLFFLDSDDWLEKDAIEVLVCLLEEYNADIVEMGIYWVYPNLIRKDSSDKDYLLNTKEVLSAYLQQAKPIHSNVTNKLFKRYIFDNLQFEEGKLHEDGFFAYQAMYKSKKYCLTSYTGYYYRQNRAGSIMSVKVKPKNLLDVAELMELRNEFFRERDENQLAEMSEAYYYRTTLTNYITAKKILKDEKLSEFLEEKLYEQKAQIKKNKYLKIKKMKFFLFFYFRSIFKCMYMRGE